jgi:hypothetical protein
MNHNNTQTLVKAQAKNGHKKFLNEKFPLAMRWCNMHPECASNIFSNNTTICPISFIQKCGLQLYICELQGSLSTSPTWYKSFYLKNIYYYFCEGLIKVIHYYKKEI